MSTRKTRAHLWLLALAAGALTLAHDALDKTAQAAPSHTLFCRGGGVQKVGVRLDRKGYRGDLRLYVESNYWLTKSKKRYSPDTLGVGECAWTDRPPNAKEPTRLFKRARTTSESLFLTFAMNPKGADSVSVTNTKLTPGWRYFGALNQSDKIVEMSAMLADKTLRVTKVRAIHSTPGNHVKRRAQ